MRVVEIKRLSTIDKAQSAGVLYACLHSFTAGLGLHISHMKYTINRVWGSGVDCQDTNYRKHRVVVYPLYLN